MKLVVSDLDGTLFYKLNEVGDYTIEIIQKLIDKNIEFAIASGRGKQGVDFLVEKLQRNVYLICNNGATIFDKSGKCIYEQVISKELSIKILKTIRENGLFFSSFYNENFYHHKDDPKDYTNRRKTFKRNILEKIEDTPALNKIIITEDEKTILDINKILREKYDNEVEITISDPKCIDIVPKNCSKGNGLKIITKLLNIPIEETMAFGDGENDLDMLRKVGYPVVMENGQEILKKEIKNIALPNSEEGVAKYLEKYFNL